MGVKTRQLVLEQIEAFLDAHPEKRYRPRKKRTISIPIQEYGRGGKTVMSAPRVRPVDQGSVTYVVSKPQKRMGISVHPNSRAGYKDFLQVPSDIYALKPSALGPNADSNDPFDCIEDTSEVFSNYLKGRL